MQIITPYLEGLIHERKARFRTWTVGTKQAQLEVAKNKQVVILGMTVQPLRQVFTSINFDYRLITDNVEYNFLDRCDLTTDGNLIKDGTFFPCYILTNQNVFLNILKFKPTDEYSSDIGAAPDKSEQPAPPVGGGTENNTGRLAAAIQSEIRLRESTDLEVLPFKSIPATLNSNTQNFKPYAPANFINDFPVNVDAPRDFPMVTVYYVIIDKKSHKT